MISDLDDLKLSEENPSEQALQNKKTMQKWHYYCSSIHFNSDIFSVIHFMTADTSSNKIFRDGTQNMQDNIQAKKCKNPVEELKKIIVSTENDDNYYQDRQYNSDDECSDFEDAESVEAYDDNEVDREHWNDDIHDAMCLNDLKRERNWLQIISLILDS